VFPTAEELQEIILLQVVWNSQCSLRNVFCASLKSPQQKVLYVRMHCHGAGSTFWRIILALHDEPISDIPELGDKT
jgi:hypothetical protein